jgi:hypothetical protein
LLRGPALLRVFIEGYMAAHHAKEKAHRYCDSWVLFTASTRLDWANGQRVPDKLVFYDDAGREAAFLTVNSKGYGTMYFQDKTTEGKVSVGYL